MVPQVTTPSVDGEYLKKSVNNCIEVNSLHFGCALVAGDSASEAITNLSEATADCLAYIHLLMPVVS